MRRVLSGGIERLSEIEKENVITYFSLDLVTMTTEFDRTY